MVPTGGGEVDHKPTVFCHDRNIPRCGDLSGRIGLFVYVDAVSVNVT